MSPQTYACSMPETRSKDRKAQLLVAAGFFFVAALLSLLTAFALYPLGVYVLPTLFAGVSTAASALSFWVWWDVRND